MKRCLQCRRNYAVVRGLCHLCHFWRRGWMEEDVAFADERQPVVGGKLT